MEKNILHIIRLFAFVSKFSENLDLSKEEEIALVTDIDPQSGQCVSHHNCMVEGDRLKEVLVQPTFKELFKPYGQHITILNLSGCDVTQLPDVMCSLLPSLEHLELSHLDITRLPPGLSGLMMLREVDVSHCEQLRCLPEEIGYCTQLR